MTIHSAKGLEFPVVCLADLGHQAAESQPAGAARRRPGASGLRLPTLERQMARHARLRRAARRRAVAAAAAEEERVIYVAMTRARERLILSGAARFANWPREGRTAIGWLGPALVADLARARRAPAAGISERSCRGRRRRSR